MTQLSPTQQRILNAASLQPKTDIREFMQELKSPAIRDKIIESMLKRGFIKVDDDNEALAYIISDAGFAAIGKEEPEPIEIERLPALEITAAPVEKAAPKSKREGVSKKQIMIDLLSREEGVTHRQLMEATGWQKHSVHGSMANLNKELITKRGLAIISAKEDDAERVYKIAKHESVKEDA